VLLGAVDASLAATGDQQRHAFSISQKYILRRGSVKGTAVLPDATLPAEVIVSVVAELPSSVSITFEIGKGRQLCLEINVHPEKYDECKLTLSLYRNFARWPASQILIRCGGSFHVFSMRAIWPYTD
jgi:hypothetical protein